MIFRLAWTIWAIGAVAAFIACHHRPLGGLAGLGAADAYRAAFRIPASPAPRMIDGAAPPGRARTQAAGVRGLAR